MLAKEGGIEEKMMYNTYNMGLGMVLCVSPDQADAALACLRAAGEKAWLVGEVRSGEKGAVLC